MKKRSELFFSAIQVPLDMAMIMLAAISAFAIRDIPQVVTLQPKLYKFPFNDYLVVVSMIIPFFILIYALEGLYDLRVTRRFWKESLKIFSATSIGLVAIIVAIFLKREWFSSRFIILSGWLLAVLYVTTARYLLQKAQKWLLKKKGLGVHRLLLVGRNGKIDRLIDTISGNPQLGYRIVEHIDSASIHAIKDIKEQRGVDEIIVCDPSLTDAEQEKLIDYCAINNIAYKFIPTTLQTARFETGIFGGEPIIEIKHTPLEGWGRILKRAFDIVASAILIAILSPVMLITALAIWIETGRPIIYKNERIGSDGKKFFVYKFRYMKWEYCVTRENKKLKDALDFEQKLIAERSIKQGPLYKIKNDPRKTKVGTFIERYSIDELPQLFNVLRGDMSLIGPRPHQEREVEKYNEYHRRLLTIKPGVSGMAQVSGRSDLEFEDEYKLDVYYIENWSLWLDIQICLKTVLTLFKKRKN
ncbi:MAG TPA: sugar transferase [Candidatus Moranbacteria bacterium]|jgi:exopolysaccharide biosynthesis polyprenyl glycosylphosphotransferase|nr:sugar transferase [Candidatus Moranbacteria bacterium]HPX94003.1 sugar transferase [Candidatus Moranbacteria bacterium]HQB59270.1 sugar transferase [Candidatus Moranbacteria bacterium]